MGLIDQWAGCILVNDGVTPATGSLFDGAIVKEKTSGIIWEARKNGGGTFDKVYVRYPAFMSMNNGPVALATGGAYTAVSIGSLITAKNLSAANINGSNQFVVPVKGIWYVRMHASFVANAAGVRAVTLEYNGNVLTIGTGDPNWENVVNNVGAGFTADCVAHGMLVANVGTTLKPALLQNSGGNLNYQVVTTVALIEPTQ
jgi:hypothetical protein